MATAKQKERKATGYDARPWLKLIPRPVAAYGNDVELYMPSGEAAILEEQVTQTSVRMSLDEAATLTITVSDPVGDLSLLTLKTADEGKLLSGVDLRWRGVWWRIARLERQDNSWVITAEDRVAAYLRAHKREMTASRADVTRAQFVLRLAKGVKAGGGIPVYIPELLQKQGIYKPDVPVAKKSKDRATASSSETSGSVWDTSNAKSSGWGNAASKVRVKGAQANSSQLAVLNEGLAEAQRLGASPRVMIAVCMAMTQESLLGEARVSISGRHKGPLHQEVGRGWARTAASANSTKESVRRFLTGGDLGAPGWKQKHGSVKASAGNLGAMIDAVQVAGTPLAFGAREPEAKKNVQIWLDRNSSGGSSAGSGDSATGASEQSYRGVYKFRTGNDGEPANWWDASGALADEVQWHRWAVSNTLGFATDSEMIRANPVLWLSRERVEVQDFSWSWDYRREASTLSVEIVLDDPFQLLPGMVAMVDDEAPVSGRWIVDSIEVDPLQKNVAAVSLRRPGAKLLEPAPEIKTTTQAVSRDVKIGGKESYGGSTGAVASPLNKILSSANGYSGGHDGVDLISEADAAIFAICDAKVIDVRSGGWWGKNPTGDISRGDGIIQIECLVNSGPFKKGMHFGYGHAEGAVVRVGQVVKAGERLGRAGFANAWHVHFMVNGGGTPKGTGDRDPMPYVNYARSKART